MVARSIELPNIRKMFIPDDGYMLIDADLERADAQVVAWEAGDEELKEIFRSGADVHTENASAVFRVPPSRVTKNQRQIAKQAVHAANYDSSPETIASETGITVKDADLFLTRWFEAHPKIKNWHLRVKADLERTHIVRNVFGYQRHIFDRIDVKKFHEALAWVPQSTVAVCTNLGLVNIFHNLPSVQLLIQVHDSLVMQAPLSECPSIYNSILHEMRIKVPYEDPLYIPVSLDVSTLSWGDLVHPDDVPAIQEAVRSSTPLRTITDEFEITEEAVKMVMTGGVWNEPLLR